MKTKQQIALITGGNRGLGFQTALELAPQNVLIIIGARDTKKGTAAAEDLQAKGYAADSVVVDVADPRTHETAFDLIEGRYGRLDTGPTSPTALALS